jgi:hypothetical protein
MIAALIGGLVGYRLGKAYGQRLGAIVEEELRDDVALQVTRDRLELER